MIQHETKAVALATRLDKGAVSDQIERLARLAEDWNGQGACPIDPRVIAAASGVLAVLPTDQVATPQVVPMTRGRLQFEWHRANRSLELEFDGPDRVRFLKYDPDRGIEDEEDFDPADTARLIELLRWFGEE